MLKSTQNIGFLQKAMCSPRAGTKFRISEKKDKFFQLFCLIHITVILNILAISIWIVKKKENVRSLRHLKPLYLKFSKSIEV